LIYAKSLSIFCICNHGNLKVVYLLSKYGFLRKDYDQYRKQINSSHLTFWWVIVIIVPAYAVKAQAFSKFPFPIRINDNWPLILRSNQRIGCPMLTKRKIAMVLIVFAVPVLFLGGAELILRIAGLHQSYPLLLAEQQGSEKVYRLNKDVAQRWFNPAAVSVPELNNTLTYAVKKPANVRRIVCLGGSTTAGFPYDNLPPFPTMLKLKLQYYYPTMTIETINLGISAINSFSVLDIVDELDALQPDAIVIYMGHNEFYGAFGLASSQNAAAATLIRLRLWLNQFAIVQIFDKALQSDQTDVSRHNESLMAAMIENTFVAKDGEIYEQTAQRFSENLETLFRHFKAQKVPVFMGNLVSNLQDQPPFQSRWKEENFDKSLITIDDLTTEGETERAIETARNILALDDTHAMLHYRYARALQAAGIDSLALDHFLFAKEFDGLRFRAPARWNDIIASATQEHGVTLVGLATTFAQKSRTGIWGKELFLEHLHPNWDGYNLMAATFARAILAAETMGATDQPIADEWLDSNPWYNITDAEIGHLKAGILSQGWPFNDNTFVRADYQPLAPPQIADMVWYYHNNRGAWNKLHHQAAFHFIQTGNDSAALAEYRAVLAYLPQSHFDRDKIGLIHIRRKDWQTALEHYRAALVKYPGHDLYHARVGQIHALNNRFDKAERFLGKSLEIGDRLPMEEIGNFYFLLAYAQANMGKIAAARTAVHKALRYEPTHTSARQLEQQLRDYKGQ
jgi:tetratricopeptide (TPR) repeat protein